MYTIPPQALYASPDLLHSTNAPTTTLSQQLLDIITSPLSPPLRLPLGGLTCNATFLGGHLSQRTLISHPPSRKLLPSHSYWPGNNGYNAKLTLV